MGKTAQSFKMDIFPNRHRHPSTKPKWGFFFILGYYDLLYSEMHVTGDSMVTQINEGS
jgi:hypothetical protein